MANVRVRTVFFTCAYLSLLLEDVASGCANGFIQLDLLRTVAQKIPTGQRSDNSLDNELRLIPDWNFTCNGTITGFKLGADIRAFADLEQYPEVQIWRTDTKVWSEEIRLNAGSFSPSGVLEYRLNNTFDFQAGDFFGIYQPDSSDSIVRIYYNDSDSTAPVAYRLTDNMNSYTISTTATNQINQQFILISPIADPSCTNGFANPVELQNKVLDVNIYDDRRRLQEQRVFPDINFTCNGSLTKWIVAGTVGDMVGGEAQIWRRNAGSENDYTKVGYSILDTTDPDNDNVYEYITNPPLEFQEGDILGVYQRGGANRTAIYYHTTTGPTNYRNNVTFNTPLPAPATLNGAILVTQYDYPLVTVEISINTEATPSLSVSVTPNSSSADAGAAVGGTIAALLILAVFVAAVITILIVVLVRRRNVQKSTVSTVSSSDKRKQESPTDFANPSYELQESGPVINGNRPAEIRERRETDGSCLTVPNNLYERKNTYDIRSVNPYEEPIYWAPADDRHSIYEQFSSKGFRELTADQIETTTKIGSGQFGCVNKGVWHSPEGQVDVAIKTLKAGSTEEEMVKFLQEAAIMGQFYHPNIVRLHGVVTVGEPTMIVLELMKDDLRKYLYSMVPTPGELAPSSLPQQLLGYCRQIASGMEYLSKKSFVHRDLAARNILVDDQKTCKIADFGMSRDLESENYYTSRGGLVPVKWTAPEAIFFKKYSTASDVWSFGVLMYEIWSLGRKPYEKIANPKTIEMIKNGVRLSPPPGCPRAIYELMIQCWHPETSGRPSFSTLLFRLSQPENQLLQWTDTITHDPKSTMLGAPLKTASNLHSDLQQQYLE